MVTLLTQCTTIKGSQLPMGFVQAMSQNYSTLKILYKQIMWVGRRSSSVRTPKPRQNTSVMKF
eukprot:312758-Ditylum_brightwellii.AAC.1